MAPENEKNTQDNEKTDTETGTGTGTDGLKKQIKTEAWRQLFRSALKCIRQNENTKPKCSMLTRRVSTSVSKSREFLLKTSNKWAVELDYMGSAKFVID